MVVGVGSCGVGCSGNVCGGGTACDLIEAMVVSEGAIGDGKVVVLIVTYWRATVVVRSECIRLVLEAMLFV